MFRERHDVTGMRQSAAAERRGEDSAARAFIRMRRHVMSPPRQRADAYKHKDAARATLLAAAASPPPRLIYTKHTLSAPRHAETPSPMVAIVAATSMPLLTPRRHRFVTMSLP
jgi:hypothetical protein